MGVKPGIHFLSSGTAWENAFQGAVQFLQQSQGTVLLGSGISENAKEWLFEKMLEKNPFQLGARIQDWKEWVKARARAYVLNQGRSFRFFNDASKREYFRFLLRALSDSDAFHHIKELWQEERFFSALLDCMEEARLAGLSDVQAIDRAREMLSSGNDAIQRAVYEDFWSLLLAFEHGLEGQGDIFDYPAVVGAAVEASGSVGEGSSQDIFLLGFDHLSLLETELVQEIARHSTVQIPLAIPRENLERIVKGKEPGLEHTAVSFARGLVNGFTGNVSVESSSGNEDSKEIPARYFLSAHSPSEEARAAASFACYALNEKKHVRFLLPNGYFEDVSVASAFREELRLPKNFFPKRTLLHPIARLFYQAVELKEKDYELCQALEVAQLLRFTLNRFHEIPSKATRAGVRKGLADWERKAEKQRDDELREFAAFLSELDDYMPARSTPAMFAEAVLNVANLCGIAELARRAVDHEIEREAHAALSAMLRNAQLLAASVKEEMSFRAWMQEWMSLISRAQAGEAPSFFPRLQFYTYGDWLPPAEEKDVTVLLGFQSGIGPNRSFCFYFEEGARRKLADLQLLSQVEEDLVFFDQVLRMTKQGTVLLSWSKHDASGKEIQPSWIASALPLVTREWPEVARELVLKRPFQAKEEARTSPPRVSSFSASLLEVYKECPFKAFALKVLRLEDKMQASSLDLGHLELGNITHKTLELYYGERKGKSIFDSEERSRVLGECLASAVEQQKVEYFKGNEELLRVQIERLRRTLLDFLAMDAEYYQSFPSFRDPDVEKKVSGILGGKFRWEGKVDRVDVDEVHKRFLVVDYKSGASTPKTSEIEELERFQLQLYMDAVEASNPGFQAAGGLYVSLKTGDRKQGLVRKEFNRTKKSKPEDVTYFQLHHATGALKSDEDFESIREASRKEAIRLAENVESGIFDVTPIHDDVCKRCEVRPACRIRELRAPERERWIREEPKEFQELLSSQIQKPQEKEKSSKGFNEEQTQALEREGDLVFIEASAGTGKTTVIVERIRRFLAKRIQSGEASHRAVERFAAISFTDKSAQELSERVSKVLMKEMGPRVAAQAIKQISTIHGFCRKILSDFPVEAGISPMADLMDERQSETLKEDSFDEFFLHTPESVRPSIDALFAEFPRAKIEGLLRKFLEQRLLLRSDIELYQKWFQKEIEAPGNLVTPGEEAEVLRHLLLVTESFAGLYDQKKRERDLLDFNDLEALALKVLEQEHARAYYREKYALLLVDEFQDTNSVQRQILERIALPGWKNLFVVGDAKQSIYRFRAADVSVFQGLRREAEKSGNLITLFRNYRSRKELVECANCITESIFPSSAELAQSFEAIAASAKPERESGGTVSLVEYGEPEAKLSAEQRRAEEAALLVKLVQEQLSKGRKPGDIAVLLRKMASNDVFLRALTHAGIPYRVGSSRGFYAQQVVLDGLALLRALYGASNDMALLAVLRSPWVALPAEEILKIQRRGAARTPLWDLLKESDAPQLFEWRKLASFLSLSEMLALAYKHYPLDRREHFQTVKLISILSRMEGEALTRVAVLDRVSLWAGWEAEENSMDDSTMPEPGSGGAVQVMTVHASKGLEFDVTILPDLNSGLQPDRSSLRMVAGIGLGLKLEDQEEAAAWEEVGAKDKERDLAESKRLLYVAVTRAKEECIFLLPREPEGKKRRGESWSDLLRASDLAVRSQRKGGNDIAAFPLTASKSSNLASCGEERELPKIDLSLQTSISELAALQFCEEFHRRKFVQGWDDRVVNLWPKPEGEKRKNPKKKSDESRLRAEGFLRALGLEKKERGIALHRVLERVQQPHLDDELGRIWLYEAYQSQGADISSNAFAGLIELDMRLLQRFLSSPLGQDLFASDAECFPEIPFQWKVGGVILHGTMDRLIRRSDGSWVVVDYKSSVTEDNQERYRFQVASYMSAIAAYNKSNGRIARIEGYLVDLYDARSVPVDVDLAQSRSLLLHEIDRMRVSHTPAEVFVSFTESGGEGGEHCFSCPYSLHCDLGQKIVLEFK